MTDWTVTVTEEPQSRTAVTTYRIVAVSPDRKRVIHRDRLSAGQVESFDPEREWARPAPTPTTNPKEKKSR